MQVSSDKLVSIKKMYKAFPLAKMKRYEPNPRLDGTAVEVIEQSLAVFGAVAPIILDEENRICCGDKRFKAAEKAGLKKFPAVVCSFADAAAFQAYNIVDNQTMTKSAWDPQELAAVWEELQAEGWTFDALAFDDGELERILAEVGSGLSGPDPNAVPAMPTKARTKAADLWVLGNHRLLCGDSTQPEHVKRLLDGEEPNLMVTDPPYGVQYDPSWRVNPSLKGSMKGAVRATGKVVNDDLCDWREAWALFGGDVAYVWHAGLFSVEVYESLRSQDFKLVSQLVWAKSHFAISRGDYHWQHELCCYAVRKGKKHNWQGARDQSTLWEIAGMGAFGGSRDSADQATGHGTQKPVECMARPMRNNSRPGDSVYEPFCGSGSTMIASERLKRRCYAMEIDPVYCDISSKRWEEFTGAKARLVRGGRKSKR